MRIDLSTGTTQFSDSGGSDKARVQPGAATPELGSDVAKLSANYGRVPALSAAVEQVPEIRQEKVAALAQMVRGGTYNVSSEDTAEALLSQVRLVSAA